ncbi:hypothetical protein PG988_003246 [Apiospora saccharicola]
MENNQAAFILAADNSPLQVGPGPDQSRPAADEIVVKVAAVAINPSEWKVCSTATVQDAGHTLCADYGWLTILQMKEFGYLPLEYPHVLGSDVAGTVVKVGNEVKRFKAGDRVIGHCLGLLYGGAKHGAFQNFTTLREAVTAPVPETARFEDAVVLPLAISTASVGLFDDLKLRLPSVDPIEQKHRDEIVLVWGAASSMGSAAVQLAVAAGYHVVTTASAKNQEYARGLASGKHITVFDYHAVDVVGEIIESIPSRGRRFAGAYDCVGLEDSTRACAAVVHAFGGGVLPSVLPPPADLPADVQAICVNAIRPGTVPGSPGRGSGGSMCPGPWPRARYGRGPSPRLSGRGSIRSRGR